MRAPNVRLAVVALLALGLSGARVQAAGPQAAGHGPERACTRAVVGPPAPAPTRGPFSSVAAALRRNAPELRLLGLAWDSAAGIGRLMSRDSAAELERMLSRWLASFKPTAAAGLAYTWESFLPPPHGLGPRKDPNRFLPGPYGTDWQGRMPSLAATMAMPYDTTMALDDVARGPDEGLRVGLRVVCPLRPREHERPVALRWIGPGF